MSVADDEIRTVGEDGIFKLLTWKSSALTRVFGLAEIVGDPIQQEFQFPIQRRVDRLYVLEDGSLLNIEHQSSISNKNALALRMITYHAMIADNYPGKMLRQIVIYTGRERADINEINYQVSYTSDDQSKTHGINFSAELRNFRFIPTDEFSSSGKIDDLILGLMAMGGDDEAYIENVVAQITSLKGVARQDAIEKCIAVCATMPDRKAAEINLRGVDMWIDEVKDTPLVQKIVDIAGKDRLEEKGRRTLASLIVAHALKVNIQIHEDAEALLIAYSDEDTLFQMANDMENMTDFNDFVKSHGVRLPGFDS